MIIVSSLANTTHAVVYSVLPPRRKSATPGHTAFRNYSRNGAFRLLAYRFGLRAPIPIAIRPSADIGVADAAHRKCPLTAVMPDRIRWRCTREEAGNTPPRVG
jgi:hypothetical protein